MLGEESERVKWQDVKGCPWSTAAPTPADTGSDEMRVKSNGRIAKNWPTCQSFCRGHEYSQDGSAPRSDKSAEYLDERHLFMSRVGYEYIDAPKEEKVHLHC